MRTQHPCADEESNHRHLGMRTRPGGTKFLYQNSFNYFNDMDGKIDSAPEMQNLALKLI